MALNHFGFEVGLNEQRTKNALPEWAHINDVVASIKTLSGNYMYGQWFRTDSTDWSNLVNAETGGDYPVIALIPYGNKLGWSFSRAHYVVIRGIDWDRTEVYFNDPWRDGRSVRRTMPYSKFEEAWGATGSRDAGPWQGVTLWPT